MEIDLTRVNYSSGAPLEERVGYSRAVRVGPFVKIGGTTAVLPDGSVFGEGSAYEQTKFVLEKFVKILEAAGAVPSEVIAVKCYTMDMAYGGEIGRAYSEIFKEVKPLFTMVGTPMLNRPTQLVEIELEAIIGSREQKIGL
jgi:enamine deaminase RidA (YjgF/YER057c/UK114 family)